MTYQAVHGTGSGPVHDAEAVQLQSIALNTAGFKERDHLQEWVRTNPIVLGNGVMIVTFEFDKWADFAGTPMHDRLDVLGIDEKSRLIVVELKRDMAADTTDMKAIKYAAMSSQFTLRTLAQHHARYLTKVGKEVVNEQQAMELLRKHVDDYNSLDDAPLLERPRIILIARKFPKNVAATSLFLTGYGLDITLLTFQLNKTPRDEYILSVSKLFPIPEIDEFRISPRSLEAAAEKLEIEARTQRAVRSIIESRALAAGTELTLVPPNTWTERLNEYLALDPNNGKAKWDPTNPARPLKWRVDDGNYSPNGLCGKIIRAAGFDPTTYQYTRWWQEPHGKTLVEMAEELG